jgi:hypothetical protein
VFYLNYKMLITSTVLNKIMSEMVRYQYLWQERGAFPTKIEKRLISKLTDTFPPPHKRIECRPAPTHSPPFFQFSVFEFESAPQPTAHHTDFFFEISEI